MEDRCVMCGAVVLEGRMVCPDCEDAVLHGEAPAPREAPRL